MSKLALLIGLVVGNIGNCLGLSEYNSTVWQKDPVDGKAMPGFASPMLADLRTWQMEGWRVFIWGAGDRPSEHVISWFARRCAQITYVDWDQKWINQLQQFVNSLKLTNVKFYCHEIERLEVERKVFGRMAVNTFSDYGEKTTYVHSIAQAGIKYDLIIIDGHHRNTCTIKALDWIKPGGRIILNDANQKTMGIDSIRAYQALSAYPHFSFLHPGDWDWRTDYWVIQ